MKKKERKELRSILEEIRSAIGRTQAEQKSSVNPDYQRGKVDGLYVPFLRLQALTAKSRIIPETTARPAKSCRVLVPHSKRSFERRASS